MAPAIPTKPWLERDPFGKEAHARLRFVSGVDMHAAVLS